MGMVPVCLVAALGRLPTLSAFPPWGFALVRLRRVAAARGWWVRCRGCGVVSRTAALYVRDTTPQPQHLPLWWVEEGKWG
ncbi:hypothetical protein SAZ_21385 [Streptomyces noursei ZPM]|nr:hypothetical protein SAZ_21385 [Streptomyces noursei ZPM]EXU86978.1 hypothetical protein P354_39395 [Streptomyces noursei PD-1]